MSIKFISLAFKAEALRSTPRFVLIALADNADANGRCYPSIAHLSQKTGLSERAVQNSIKELRNGHYIDVQAGAGRNGTNVYSLLLGSELDAPTQEVPPAENAPGARTGCTPPPEGAAPKPSDNHHEPSIVPPQPPTSNNVGFQRQVAVAGASEDVEPKSKDEKVEGGLAGGCLDIFEEFERVWQLYPRKVSKGAAKKKWVKVRRTVTFFDIFDPLCLWVKTQSGTEMKYIPHFSKWLEDERWEDDQSHSANKAITTAERFARLGGLKAVRQNQLSGPAQHLGLEAK